MSTLYVKTGFWVDYNRSLFNRCQILLDDYWAGILTNAIAVLITSTSVPILNLSLRPMKNLLRKISPRWRTYPLDGALESAKDWQALWETILQSHPRDEYELAASGLTEAYNGPRGWIKLVGSRAMFVYVLGLTVALITASILSSGLATDTIAQSSSSLCGSYEWNSTSGNSFLEFEQRVEAQSGIYAKDCYGTSPLVDDCNKFYNQSIAYSVDINSDCPFTGGVCDPAANSVRFNTGLVSGSVLGINAVNPLFFSRSMTCSPLVTGEEYVGIGLSNRREEQWEYWYGSSLADYTFAHPVHESPWEIKGYSTGVHCSEPSSPRSMFQPLSEFTAGPFPVTMLFISSHTIFYPDFRDDLIFPAHQKAQFSAEYRGPTLFYNNSTRAGVLGCVDQYQICKSITGPCWDNGNITSLLHEQVSGSDKERNVILLLLLALKFSTACGSIQFRGAEALDAQAKIAHVLSLRLAKNQWPVEAEMLFQTSLARIQFNIFDTSRGTAASFDGYNNIMPEEYRGICQLAVIPTVGWRNINFLGLLGTIIAVLLVWGISPKRKVSTGEKRMVAVLILEDYVQPAIELLAASAKFAWPWVKFGGRGVWECFLWIWTQVRLWILDPLAD